MELPQARFRRGKECGLEAVDVALTVLEEAAPRIKRQVLQAAAACIAADRKLTMAEAELLRAMSASLGLYTSPQGFLGHLIAESPRRRSVEMRKHDQSSVAAEGARRATGAAAARDRKGRFSARRKRATVLRLLRGEDLESVSRELGITAARASQWRDRFVAAGQAGLKSRATEAVDDDHRRLQATIGELLMETELLYAKVDQLEAGRSLARRRSTQ